MSGTAIKIIAVILNLGVLAFVYRTWELCRDNYPKLPDKIPVHFGFSGSADGWARKSRFSVFWPAGLIVVLWALLFGSFYIVPRSAGVMEAEGAVAGGLISLALSYMFFSLTKGMHDYALGNAKSIYPYLWKPLILVLLSSLAPASLPLFAAKKQPVLVSAILCKGISGDMKPVGEMKTFYDGESHIFAVLEWNNLNGKRKIEYRWIGPSGKVVKVGKGPASFQKFRSTRRLMYMLDLSYFRRQMDVTGWWSLDIFLDGKKVRTLKFNILR